MLNKISNFGNVLNKTEQKNVFGGNIPPIPFKADKDPEGNSGSGGGSDSTQCPWSQCRNRMGRCIPKGLQNCA